MFHGYPPWQKDLRIRNVLRGHLDYEQSQGTNLLDKASCPPRLVLQGHEGVVKPIFMRRATPVQIKDTDYVITRVLRRVFTA